MQFIAEQDFLGHGITAIVSILVTGGGAWIIKLLSERHKQQREDRGTAIAEWREIVTDLQAKDNRQEEEIKQLSRQMADNYTEAMKEQVKCQVENAELRADNRVLEQRIRQVEHLTGTPVSIDTREVLVTADVHGKILNISPYSAPVFHYLPKELLGRSIEVLVPERLLEQHRAGLKKLRESGQLPDPNKTIITYGLTKEGEEVPINISLSGYKMESGEILINATFRKRTLKLATEEEKP